jgi:hypothetical protein
MAAEPNLESYPPEEWEINRTEELASYGAAAHIAFTWPLVSPRFDGEVHLRGPVPILFTDQPEELRSLLAARPDPFLPYLNKAMKRLVDNC